MSVGRCRRSWQAAAASAAALLLLGVCTANAQDEPVILGATEKLPPFSLQRPHGSFDLLGLYSSEKGDASTGPDNKTTELLFEESLTLETNGYIVHPNLLDLYLRGTFGLTQDDFDRNGVNDRSDTTLYLWDAQARFFREQQTNLTLYTDRTEHIVDRAFSQSTRDTYTTYGALLATQFRDLPSTFRVYRTEQTQEDLGGGGDDFTLTDNVFEWHSEFAPASNQSLTWDYRLNQTDQSSTNGIDDSSTGQFATLGHSIFLGPKKQHSLGSIVSYSDATGNLGVERFRWNELLRLNHSQTFRSEYEYNLEQQSTDTVDQTLQRATADFWHKLYLSLWTHGEVGYQQLDVGDGGGSQQYFGSIDFDYTKQVPKGTLLGTLLVGYEFRATQASDEPIEVVAQPIQFSNFQPVLIRGQTIVPTSIILRDANGRFLTENVDYTVTPRPDGAEVRPLPGGEIGPTEQVFADYTLGPLPDTDINTARFGISLRYNIEQGRFRGLSPYVRFGLIEQDISGGEGTIRPESSRDYVVGVEYRIRDWTLKAEHEIFDSTLAPFDATRLEARIDRRVSYETVLTGRALLTLLEYPDQGQETNTLSLTAAVTHRLTRELTFTGTADWITIDDSLGGTTWAFQQVAELRWRHRQVEIYGRLRNSYLSTDDEDTTFQLFQIGFRREF